MQVFINILCVLLCTTNSFGTTIILLNGTSSAGKTSISQALQKKLLEPYLYVALDHFLVMLPPRYADFGEQAAEGVQFIRARDTHGQPIITVRCGPLGNTLLKSMQETLYYLAKQGCNLIIDEVIFQPERLHTYLELFADFDVYYIGVKPPVEVSVQREKARGDREVGLARGLFEQVHQHMVYDLELDTATLSSDQCAALIVQRMHSPEKPQAFHVMRTKMPTCRNQWL